MSAVASRPVLAQFALGGQRSFGRTTFVTWEPELHPRIVSFTYQGEHNLYYNISGMRRLSVSGTWYTVGPDCLLISMDGESCVAPRMSAMCKSITVHVTSVPGDAVVWKPAASPSATSVCRVPRFVRNPGVHFRLLLEEVVYLANSSTLSDRQLALLRLEDALLHLQRGAEAPGMAHAPGRDSLLSFIREDMVFFPQRDHRAASVAARLGISEATLRRWFKSATGKTLKGFHNELRVRMAMEILEANRRISLKELAEYLGFYDQFHFSKTFKAIVGSPPRSYRLGVGRAASGRTR